MLHAAVSGMQGNVDAVGGAEVMRISHRDLVKKAKRCRRKQEVNKRSTEGQQAAETWAHRANTISVQ